MDIELRTLRVFRQVMIDKSFSKAARSLKIAQPTVSQQIAKLEFEYGSRLFERVGHDIVPTLAAQELLAFAQRTIESIDDFYTEVAEGRKLPRGLVRYAMPETCQWTPHFRKIMNQIREFPEIRFEIDILPSERIVAGLLEAKYDFGFVVGEKLAPELRFEKFSNEKYSLVSSNRDLFFPLEKKKCPRFIGFPGAELFFTTWCKSQKMWTELKSELQQPSVQIGTLAGAIYALKEGAGVAIIPTHCVLDELKSGSLFEYKELKGSDPTNPIYLTKRGGEKAPRRVELVIDMLRKAKLELG